jgi:hypothetical protein
MPQIAFDARSALEVAEQDYDSVVALTRALVQTPSRAGIDAYEPVIKVLTGWAEQNDLPMTALRISGCSKKVRIFQNRNVGLASRRLALSAIDSGQPVSVWWRRNNEYRKTNTCTPRVTSTIVRPDGVGSRKPPLKYRQASA